MIAWLVWAWWRVLAAVFARYELIRVDGEYLSRWHYPEWIARRLGAPYAFLHYFHTSDPDRGWHNHPWIWLDVRILRGAYVQEIPYFWRGEWRAGLRTFVAGQRNRLTSEYHRVLILRRPVWTLALAGPRHGRSWGFMDHLGRTWPANPGGMQ